MAMACRPENETASRASILFASSRESLSWRTPASERRVDTFVASPNRISSQARTKSDQEPRGSLGSQKPYAVTMRWYARTGCCMVSQMFGANAILRAVGPAAKRVWTVFKLLALLPQNPLRPQRAQFREQTFDLFLAVVALPDD